MKETAPTPGTTAEAFDSLRDAWIEFCMQLLPGLTLLMDFIARALRRATQ